MFCKHCGTPLEDTVETCPNCGTTLTEVAEPASEVVEIAPGEVVEILPEPVPAAAIPAEPVEPTAKVVYQIPPENEPLSAWSYFWLKVLFSVPIVGFVFLMIFTFHGGNLNRRSFARSYWCGLLVTVIVLAVLALIVYGFAFNLRLFIPKQY
ncbi:MAG: zinc-ribbon domain-containing protein [Oscillospiraceae bacterium]|nr:zinc-ribbon domain-containing protein [Oscillospiraceae bacterium]